MELNVIIFYGKLIYSYYNVPIAPSVGDMVILGGSAFRVTDRLFDYSQSNEVTVKVMVG